MKYIEITKAYVDLEKIINNTSGIIGLKISGKKFLILHNYSDDPLLFLLTDDLKIISFPEEIYTPMQIIKEYVKEENENSILNDVHMFHSKKDALIWLYNELKDGTLIEV